ncbi:unnamed protein product [Lupinus luteus]|uniref:Uncharacterized protein n=1 Tax=Lupinus luteus TaxID=3873 RepID=A0AAV1X116_LUPLU
MDRQKIKGGGGNCNGGTQAVVNGVDVGDLVAVINDNGDGGSGAEGLKVSDGESQVTVSEIKNKESVGTDSSAISKVIAKEEIREKEISNGMVSVDGGNSNLGSVTILDVSGDLDVADVVVVDEGVIDVNKKHNKDQKIENSVAG